MSKRKTIDKDLQNLQLILLDLDGTLLNKKGVVTETMIKSINRLQSLGVKVTLASARVHPSMVKFAELLNIDLPIISLDGALIKNKDGNIVLYHAPIKPRIVSKAIKLAEQYLLHIGLCHQDEIIYNQESTTLPMILDKTGAYYKEVDSFENYLKDTLEILCVGDHRKNLETVSKKLKFPFAVGTSVNIYRSRLYPEIYYVECKKAGSSKANAFYKLIRYLKIKESNTMVVGDWYNDIPLFKTKAIKVALKNSITSLKLRADIILNKTNDEDALEEIFNKIITLKS